MSNYQKFVAGFDIHGDMQSGTANKAFFNFVDNWKPEIRVCGGDLWDFRALRNKASDEERRDSLSEDYVLGREWLLKLEATHFLRGNHDERLWDLALTGNGIAADYADDAIIEVNQLMKSLRCKMYPYDRRAGVLKLGHLKMVHGFSTGANAARRTAQVYGSVLMGHGHAIQHSSIEGLENRVGRMCGCLCQLDMDYSRAQMGSLVWRHGWAYGVIDKTNGNYHVWQAEDVNGTFLVASDIVEVR